MPVTREDVERAAGGDADRLRPDPAEAVERLDHVGDPFADVLTVRRRLPGSSATPGR